MATERLSLFATTFNLNGSLPSLADVRLWLQGQCNGNDITKEGGEHHQRTSRCSASDADLVVISLQESPVATNAVSSTSGAGPERIEPMMFSAGMSGPSNNCTENKGGETEFLDKIQSVLSKEHDLVADVSMGAKSCSRKVEWHGYLRLLVYARGSEFVTELRRSSIGIAIAVGGKAMSRSNKILSNNAPPNYTQYHALGSPDKGAVCLVMPTLKMVAVCVHLAGTNKHGVAEVTFDRTRHKQLHVISRALDDTVQNIGCSDENIDSWRKIIAGDLNFRVEVHDEAEHKCRGGEDWKAVADIVQGGGQDDSGPTCNQQRVAELFCCHDRLVQYLEKGPIHLQTNHGKDGEDDDTLTHPKLLNSIVDLIHYKCFLGTNTSSKRDPQIIMPTFSFQAESHANDVISSDASDASKMSVVRRQYSDKRTPSWPDRILMSRELVEKGDNASSIVTVGSCPRITLSDHCPVWSYAGCLDVR